MDAQSLEILKPMKILVIQTAFLGDAVLTLPLIQKLKGKYPNSLINVLCIPSTKELFINSEFVYEAIEYDKKHSQKSLLDYFKLVFRIRKSMYDMVISPHRSARSTLISKLSGAAVTVGFNTSSMSFLYKKVIEYNKEFHEVKRNLSLIEKNIDSIDWKVLPKLKDIPQAKERIVEFVNKLPGKKIIAVAPGSVWKTKKYPKENFVLLIRHILKREFYVLLIGGKEDVEVCRQIEEEFDCDVKSVAGEHSVVETVELLKHCSALVCNDSAPTHLGMIVDIPVLTIYCSTVPQFGFYPYNKKSQFISLEGLNCKPCGIHGHETCPIKTFECGNELKPESVMNKLSEILSD